MQAITYEIILGRLRKADFFHVGNTLLELIVRSDKSVDYHMIVLVFGFDLFRTENGKVDSATQFFLWKVLLKQLGD